jgi:hypothetical protein
MVENDPQCLMTLRSALVKMRVGREKICRVFALWRRHIRYFAALARYSRARLAGMAKSPLLPAAKFRMASPDLYLPAISCLAGFRTPAVTPRA